MNFKGFTLRNYQETAMMDIAEFLGDDTTYKKSIAVLPTGAGKSLLIAAAASLVESPIVVIQPSKELLSQNITKFRQMGGEATVFSASLKSKELSHVTFGTPGSLVKVVDKLKASKVKHVIIDESHLACAPGSQTANIVKGLGDKVKVLGLTATPILLRPSLNGAELAMLNRTRDSIFSDIIHVTQINQLVKDSFWCPLEYRVYQQDKAELDKNSNGSDFTEESVIRYYKDNNLEKQVVDVCEILCEERKSILIFAPSIEAAEKLSALIPGSACVHSKMDSDHRDLIIKNFMNGSIQVCVNVNVLSVGFDHPALDTIIETSPTMSMARYYQKIGRCVRIHPTKEKALVVDMSGNFERFGRIENITFENLPDYGWGMFNGEYLLSGYPIASPKRKRNNLPMYNTPLLQQKMWFGKYNGVALIDLPEDYIKWMLGGEFKFETDRAKELKRNLEKILAL